MLTEGWDTKTVTHILGLRAFSSQLLCEQVIGRGLRRKSYDIDEKTQRFLPEYVNIFGIPFSFLPYEDKGDTKDTAKSKIEISALPEKQEFEISWPNIIRIDRELNPVLHIDISKIDTLTLDAADTALRADLAPVLDGKTDLRKCTDIDLQKIESLFRMQSVI